MLSSMKKAMCFVLICTMLFCTKPVYGAEAEKKAPVINALAAVVIEASSGRVLYEKNATNRRSIASTTKIMTAIVALENGDLEDEVSISKRAAEIGGSTIGLQAGQTYSLKDLLYAMLLSSGNDAAIAVAEHIGGSVEDFADMMNRKAVSIGAADSHFITPHGLDKENQYSTAYDVAIITRFALNNPTFAKIVATTDYYIPGHGLYNTNELLTGYSGVDGVKTGYTGKAGRCLVTTAQCNDMRLITVVLGSPTRTARATASKALLDYAFENFSMYRLVKAGDAYATVPVERGIQDSICLIAAQDIELPLSIKELESLEKRVFVPDGFHAPVYAGTETGFVEFVLKGETVGSSTLMTTENIRKKVFSDYLAFVFKAWCRMMREGIFAGS